MARRRLLFALVTVLGSVIPASAQSPGPLTEAARGQFDYIHGLVMRSAERIGEDLYAFKPTPAVRSVAGVLGHIADGNILLCTAAAGDKPVITRTHEKKTSKAEIIAALKEAKAFCDGVAAKLTDALGAQPTAGFDQTPKTPRLSFLHSATSHTWEHYGNLVTYMRLNNITPPSSVQ